MFVQQQKLVGSEAGFSSRPLVLFPTIQCGLSPLFFHWLDSFLFYMEQNPIPRLWIFLDYSLTPNPLCLTLFLKNICSGISVGQNA